MDSLGTVFLESAVKRLTNYKSLCDATFMVLTDADFHYLPNEESNSIAVIIQHMAGNMLSRWTDFLTTDGEKEWRNRDEEFVINRMPKQDLIALWERGWTCCIDAIKQLNENDLLQTITIRTEPLTVVDAINRQLAHYPYHAGQIIYIAKMIKNQQWISLSIPKNQSADFNQSMQQGRH